MRKSPQPPIVKQCQTCGRQFRVHVCVMNRGAGKYCSVPCRPYRGAGNPKWRGGRFTDPNGRVLVYAPDQTMVNNSCGGTHAYEYRLIAARALGRPLSRNDVVHHINGNPSDNRPENLQVMTRAEHIHAHGLPGHNRKEVRA